VRRSEGLSELAATDLTPLEPNAESEAGKEYCDSLRCDDFLPGLTFPRLAESVVLHVAGLKRGRD
jgi:hypothetical protein